MNESALECEWDCTRVLFSHVGEYRDIHTSLADGRGGEVLHAALARVVAEVLREARATAFDADGYRISARALKDVRLQDLLVFERPGDHP